MSAAQRAFIIEVMLHDERWHGGSEWPPSPFRLFQALVAAAARGSQLHAADRQALTWLEELEPPTIAAPRTLGAAQPVLTYVPNNDLDAVGGDPDRVEEIRAPKRTQPRLLQGKPHFLYIWRFEAEDGAHAPSQHLIQITRRLYQFGRGVDMAWARAQVLAPEEAIALLRRHDGTVHDPCDNGSERLQAPTRGSLRSLEQRFANFRSRLKVNEKQIHFRQPPKPVSRMVGYHCPAHRQLFDIRDGAEPENFAAVGQRQVTHLVEQLRDMAAHRLREAGVEEGTIERYLIGRNAGNQDKKRRVRIIPIPSIGHEHAGGNIRRVLIETPPDCPLHHEDIVWALTGEVFNPDSGELTGQVLVPSDDTSMLRHYGIGDSEGHVLWRTITPAALPAPRHGKTGSARLATEEQAIKAVRTALRHAGVRAHPAAIRVQREPFDRNSRRADQYQADNERFDPRALWHVEILFDEPVTGPLLIGNGRYLGLGLMAPAMARQRADRQEAFSFALSRPLPASEMDKLLKVARAALMKLDAAGHERHRACPLFSGHPADDATPLRQGHHAHIFLAAPPDAQGQITHLHVIPPWLADHSTPARKLKEEQGRHFAVVTRRLKALFAPDLPRLALSRAMPQSADALFGPARAWASLTPYLPTRHPKGEERADLPAFIAEDIRRELSRRALPLPERIEVTEVRQGPRGGLRALARLEFHAPVKGPFLLGRACHQGLGCFAHT
jgi:CRISPR-associated protein Csb2